MKIVRLLERFGLLVYIVIRFIPFSILAPRATVVYMVKDNFSVELNAVDGAGNVWICSGSVCRLDIVRPVVVICSRTVFNFFSKVFVSFTDSSETWLAGVFFVGVWRVGWYLENLGAIEREHVLTWKF